MSYDGPGEISAIYRPHDEVRPLLVRTTEARFVAPGSLTAGRFGLFRWTWPLGPEGPARIPSHVLGVLLHPVRHRPAVQRGALD